MDHYLDIELRPDPEFPASQLMSALFAKLHRALAEQADQAAIGVSFPGYEDHPPNLGQRLRLHASQPELTTFMEIDWLTGMRDHVQHSRPAAVPEKVQHRVVRRVQVQSNPERMRRRLMSRHELDAQQALERIPDSAAQFVKLPFVQLRSRSTGQNFRLFIAHGPLLNAPTSGTFGAYGLSQTRSVPWF
jgi:CRISPR-associated endonuclease Csy4